MPVFALPSVLWLMGAISLKLSLAKAVSDLRKGVFCCESRQEKSLSLEKFQKSGKTALPGSKAYFFPFASRGTKHLKSLLINLLNMSSLHPV